MYRKRMMAVAACFAALACASVADAAKQGQTCGGLGGIQCDAGLWCQMRPGQCKVADGMGTCAKAPEICNKMFLPVCGCDRKTYGNDCERQAHKVSKAHNGACS